MEWISLLNDFNKQESMICVVDSNHILFDVTSSDLLDHSITMVNGM